MNEHVDWSAMSDEDFAVLLRQLIETASLHLAAGTPQTDDIMRRTATIDPIALKDTKGKLARLARAAETSSHT
jgi:hypothetical protein